MQDMTPWYQYAYRAFAAAGLVVVSPLLGVLYITVKASSPGPFIFSQKRTGKDKKPFNIYKIRTMHLGAEKLQGRLKKKNEADGPVFKIRNDPRFTPVGKWLSGSGLDELPQLWNICRGEMSFVGPRPLPVPEAKCVPARFAARFSVLPGITSPWVVNGNHSLSFSTWMELDVAYAKEQSFLKDLFIMSQTVFMIIRNLIQ